MLSLPSARQSDCLPHQLLTVSAWQKLVRTHPLPVRKCGCSQHWHGAWQGYAGAAEGSCWRLLCMATPQVSSASLSLWQEDHGMKSISCIVSHLCAMIRMTSGRFIIRNGLEPGGQQVQCMLSWTEQRMQHAGTDA